MKGICKRLLLLSCIYLYCFCMLAAVSESFDADDMPTDFQSVGNVRVYSSRYHTEPHCCRLYASTSSERPELIYIGSSGQGKDNGVGTLSFYHKRYKSSFTSDFVVEYSIDGSPYIPAGEAVTSGDDYALWTSDLNIFGEYIKVRVRGISEGRLCFYLDNIEISDNAVPAASADASLSESTHQFDILSPGNSSTFSVTVTNGASPVTENLVIDPAGFTFTGDAAANFQVQGFSGQTLAPGESTSITVAYTPANDGKAHQVEAVLASNDRINPALTLSGSNYLECANLAEVRTHSEDTYMVLSNPVTVTVASNGLNSGLNQFFAQDSSGADGCTGIRVDDPTNILNRSCTVGEQLISLSGKLVTKENMLVLEPFQEAVLHATGVYPPAVTLSGSEDFSAIESELVSLSNVYIYETGFWQAGTDYSIVRPENIQIDVLYIDENSALAGYAIPPFKSAKSVMGIAVQSSEKKRISPRIISDINYLPAGTAAISTTLSNSLDLADWSIYNGRKGTTFEISNNGDAPFQYTGDGFAFSGTDAAQYSVFPTAQELPAIFPGQTIQYAMYCDPEEVKDYSSELTISSDADNESSITAQVTISGIIPAPKAWDRYGCSSENQNVQHMQATVTKMDAPAWDTGITENINVSGRPCILENGQYPRVFAFGSDGSGYSASKAFVKCFNGNTGALIWTSEDITDIGSSLGYDSWHSLVADTATNSVYMGIGNHVFCFNADTGTLRWTSPELAGQIVNATVQIGDQLCYLSTYGGYGGDTTLHALRLSDGTEAWNYVDKGQGQETVVYHHDGIQGYVYHTIADDDWNNPGGGIICLKADDGAVVWSNRHPLKGDAWLSKYNNFGGIMMYDGLIFAPTYNFGGTSELMCVNAYTGELVWLKDDSIATDSTPCVVNNTVFVSGHYNWGSGGDLVGYNLDSGEKVVDVRPSSSSNMWTVSVAATNNILYITEGSRLYGGDTAGLHYLNPTDGAELVTERTGRANEVTGTVALGSDGSVYAFYDSAKTGLGGLICYRVPCCQAFTVSDQDGNVSAGQSDQRQVNVSLQASSASKMRIYEDGVLPGEWVDFEAAATFELSGNLGAKVVYVELSNGSGFSERKSRSITLVTDPADIDNWMCY